MDQQEDPTVDQGRTSPDETNADAPSTDEANVDLASELEQVYAAASAPETTEEAAEATEAVDDAAEIADEPSGATSDAAPAAEAPESVGADDVAAETSEVIDLAAAEATDGAAEGDEEPAEEDLWVPGDWYVVHTYAGYENKVKVDLETRVASMNMEDSIFEVVIPMEEVMEIKSGKKQMVPRKVFPGYLLVRMDLNDDSWYVVRNTPGVTGFVGSGNKPIPLSAREVDKILSRGKPGEVERPKPVAEWQANDNVRVTTGPFANFQGSVSEVDLERQKVKVLVNIFGRETPVELSFDQISKV